MKKKLTWILIIFVLGGIGYFFYNDVKKVEGKPHILAETPMDKEVVKKEDIVELRTDIPLDMVWEYSFDQSLDIESISNQTVSVIDEKNEMVNVFAEIVDDGKLLRISPPASGYKRGKKYDLFLSKEILYIDGTNVSKDFHLSFVTLRDEVEEGRLNPAIINIAQEHLNVLGNNILEVKKDDFDNSLNIQDIIIVPSEQHPEGQALKITSLEEDSAIYTLEVEEPEFIEIYEELDIYKSYQLNSANFIPASGAEGVTVKTITAANPINIVAGFNTSKSKEFEEKKRIEITDITNGIQIDLKDTLINKEMGVTMNGTLRLLSPEIKVDMKHKFLKVDHMSIETKMNVYNDTTVKRNDEKNVMTKSGKPNEFNLELGKIFIPTAIPGLVIRGDVMAMFKLDVNGGPEVQMFIEYDHNSGVFYDGEEVDYISNSLMDLDIDVKGTGAIEGKAGPSLDALVTGFGVAGIGIKGFSGLKLLAEGTAGTDTKNGPYACSKADFGGFAQLSAIVKKWKKIAVEIEVAEFPIGNKSIVDNCKSVIGFASMKPLLVDAAEKIEVKVESQIQDLLSKSKWMETANMEDVNVTVSDEGILDVEKLKEILVIQIHESPQVETTEITLTQKIGVKDIKLVIPVKIKDFNRSAEETEEAVVEEIEEDIEEIEVERAAWEGVWERNEIQNGGTLVISNFNGQTFNLDISAYNGGRTGGLEGMARVAGSKAIVEGSGDVAGCILNLNLTNNTIVIEENTECISVIGTGASFMGEYQNAAANVGVESVSETLSSRNILNDRHDKVIQQLLGDDYKYLVENMQMISNDQSKYGLSDTLVFEGGVRSMYTIMEGLILIEPSGNYYIANIVDGNKVRFYTNDTAYRNEVPFAVDQWRSRFSGYPIEYIYKNVN